MKNNKISLVFITALLIVSGCYKDPQASFTVSSSSVEIDETVTFTNTSMDMDRCEWLFGDGDQSTETNPSHTYSDPGAYTVTLRVFSKKDFKADKTTSVINVIQPTYLIINVLEYDTGDALDSAVVELFPTEDDFYAGSNLIADDITGITGKVSFKDVPDGKIYISVYKYAYQLEGYDYFYSNWFISKNGNTYNTVVVANQINELDIYARLGYYSARIARHTADAGTMNQAVQ